VDTKSPADGGLPLESFVEGVRHDCLIEFFARLKVLARESSDPKLIDLMRLVAEEMNFDVDDVVIGPHGRTCRLCNSHQQFNRVEVRTAFEGIDRLKKKIWYQWMKTKDSSKRAAWIESFGNWLRNTTLTND